ncbi:ABC transporter permease [Paenibacillus thermotolerans]|uniref:ABC transporter permease n=1 Tax=Paenibacillus thermotolerans TaxID=3027807 RepID=UPI0023682919|nr:MULTISPECIES: ABC-2 family transporter protein [unclassified Paenibacillus]
MLTAVSGMKSLAVFLGTCWKCNLASALEYRVSFLLTAGMMLLNDFVWIFFWSVFFNRFNAVNGWELQDVMMMWAVSAGGFGIAATLFGNMNRIAVMTANGQLDVYLAQPKPVLLNVLASRMSVSAIGDFSFSVVLYFMFGDGTLSGFLKYVLAHIVSAAIFLFFCVAINSLAFWFGNAEGLSQQLFMSMITFTTYPTDIFRGAGRLIIFTVVPAGFISYMPIGLMRSAVDWPFLLGALGVSALLGIGAVKLFYAGLRRYSSGNLMAMRG